MSLTTSHTEAQVLQQRSSRPRLLQLDALRGLAALMVVCSHMLLTFPRTYAHWQIQLYSMGRSAVVLFFVLSGYVLSLPFWSGRKQGYGRYLLRRFCRIYLPFAAAAALAIAGACIFRNSQASLSHWFLETWAKPITLIDVLKQFLMVPMTEFNTAFWSLTYEMQMSIVMPLLCWLLLRLNPAICTTFLAALLYVRPLGVVVTQMPYVWVSLQVLFLFCLGACLSFYERPLREAFRYRPALMPVVLLAGLFLYLDGPLLLSIGHENLLHQITSRDYLINGIGAAIVVVGSLHIRWFAGILEHKWPEYLGRISYSFYLTHATVLFALCDLLYGRAPTWALMVLATVTMFAGAHLFCIAVEEPSMRLGKRLTSIPARDRSALN
jgi:peptidoglycan/LPS O-acetylase OafA/YrhL